MMYKHCLLSFFLFVFAAMPVQATTCQTGGYTFKTSDIVWSKSHNAHLYCAGEGQWRYLAQWAVMPDGKMMSQEGTVVIRQGQISTNSEDGALVFNSGPVSTATPSSGFWFRSNATIGEHGAPYTDLMRITADGNVGIGVTSPTAKLDVQGDINIGTNAVYKIDGENFVGKGTTKFSTFVGSLAGEGNTGSSQSAFGRLAGYNNTASSQSVFGVNAGRNNKGLFQSAFGVSAGYYNIGDYQTAFGFDAGTNNKGISQTSVGRLAGAQNIGNYQTVIGAEAGHRNTADNLVAIGYQAGKENATANQFIVQQRNVNITPLIQGDFATGKVGIGVTNPTEALQVNGNIDVSDNRILRLANPTNDTDAANKWYVDMLGGRTGCNNGQLLKWDGDSWECANDNMMLTEGGGSGRTMLPNWPDAVMCEFTDNVLATKHLVAFYVDGWDYENNLMYYTRPAVHQVDNVSHRLVYTNDGQYSHNENQPQRYTVDCDNSAYSISQLYAANRAFNFVGGGSGASSSGSATPMVAGWPDALICGVDSGKNTILTLQNHFGGYHEYVQRGNHNYSLRFNSSTKDYDNTFGWLQGGIMADCEKPISQLYAEGRAFNFVGGGAPVGSLTSKADLDGSVWPDSMVCYANSMPRAVHFLAKNATQVVYQYTFANASVINLLYNVNNGAYLGFTVSGSSTYTIDTISDVSDPCRVSVQAVAAAGHAHNMGGSFGGGSGPGSGSMQIVLSSGEKSGAIDLSETITIPVDGVLHLSGHITGGNYPVHTLQVNGSTCSRDRSYDAATSNQWASASCIKDIPAGTHTIRSFYSETSGGANFSLHHMSWSVIAKTLAANGGSDNLGNHTATENVNLNGNWLSGDGSDKGLYVTAEGNVGIGTTTPNRFTANINAPVLTLETTDTARLKSPALEFSRAVDSLTDKSEIFAIRGITGVTPQQVTAITSNISGTNVLTGDLRFWTRKDTETQTKMRMIITKEGNIGIGNFDTPDESFDLHKGHLLHTGGSIVHFYNSYYTDGQLKFAGYTAAPQYAGRVDFNPNAGAISLNVSNNMGTRGQNITGWGGITILANGNVGIDAAPTTYKLQVNGTAYASGAAGALSDARHKHNIRTLETGLESVLRLRPVTFEWNTPTDKGMEGTQLGFIAQEVEEILPDIVITQDDEDATKGLKPTAMIPVLVKAIQELKIENDALRSEINDIKTMLDKR